MKKRLSVLFVIVLLAAALVGSVQAAPSHEGYQNLVLAKVIYTMGGPANSDAAVFAVDLLFAEHLYNLEDGYFLYLPVGTTAMPGDTLALDCNTDPEEWDAINLYCDLVTVYPLN